MRGSKGNVSCLPLLPDLDRVLVLGLGQTLLPQPLQLGGVIVLGIFIVQDLEYRPFKAFLAVLLPQGGQTLVGMAAHGELGPVAVEVGLGIL